MLLKILRLFVRTLTPYDKYSLLIRDNSSQPVEILLSQKKITFSQFLSAFLKSPLNFEYFRQNDGPHSRCISEINDSK